ncbi:MAG: SRPBCC family protein, partial [Solirubrobacteraceae bacterium]
MQHATFVVERRYEVSPGRVFAAWAKPEAKARWFVDADAYLELDFRVGGREHSRGTAPDGSAYSYEALYQDIVPAQRIVYSYDMLLQETRISVSLATVEFTPVGDNGTRLVFTEQGAFLDGHETPARRAEGMGSLLDALDKELQRA